MDSLLKRLQQVGSLPVLSETVRELQRLIIDDIGDASDLVELVEKDVSLSSAVLSCANSVLYNYSGKPIVDLQKAIVRVGREELYSMLLTNALMNTIPQENCVIDYHSFWVQSLATAALARRIKKQSQFEVVKLSTRLYTAALFHDIGVLLYATCFIPRLQEIRHLKKENGWSFTICEDHISPDESHASLGATLLELWRIDTAITQIVRYHEMPYLASGKSQSSAALLHICAHLVSMQLPEYELFTEIAPLGEVYEIAGLDPDQGGDFFYWAQEEVRKAFDTLSLWSTVSLRPIGSISLFRPV